VFTLRIQHTFTKIFKAIPLIGATDWERASHRFEKIEEKYHKKDCTMDQAIE
jgi:hypothetical protein